MKKAKAPARFMSPLEYSGHVGKSERTVRQWIYDRVIPSIKIGNGGILIDPIKADQALERSFEKKAIEPVHSPRVLAQ
jgi:hypothetical protein